MTRLLSSKFIQIVLVIAILMGIATVFYDSFFGEVESEDNNQVNRVLLGSVSAKFKKVSPDDAVILPQDFRFHPEYQHEWWHYFANVKDKQGQRYGVQWSFFRVATDDRKAVAWENPQLYISHMVVTSEQQVWKQQRLARGGIGQAGMTLAPFKIWIDDWHWKSLGRTPFPGRLDLDTDQFSVQLANYAAGPFVLNGDAGYLQKHPEVASYSVSAPFIRAKGALLLDGEMKEVEGLAWLTKEWGTGLLAEDHQGWDYFAIRLDKQQTLMVNHYRHADGTTSVFGTLANKKGDVIILDENDVSATSAMKQSLQSGRKLPLKWRIRVPEHAIDIEITPARREQWLPFAIPYWEGPVNTVGTHKATGLMQLTGY
ncbi:lipocalin-like domain-containing protein [Vibrio sp. SCSIO 43136]|uniref:lipocalin-like domain-containing protein n=1 Tax=Vibrio sp. SCSIO 43136 TaxID=2819101 RepID=UPI002074B0A9|nr:lipocalin-like domain-containing protein [Vibrio sp. SCSIO 43136]USD64163.1 carotenoid 1,2-hydratase [Vibrio sp. SCSIO 43136]